MASLWDRILLTNDYEEDGGLLSITIFRASLELFSAGDVTAAQVKMLCGCTTAQGLDMQDILDTAPNPVLALLDRARWAATISSACYLAQEQLMFTTENALKAELGV